MDTILFLALTDFSRLAAYNQGQITAAKPKRFFFSSFATASAIIREVTYSSVAITMSKRFRWSSPTVGSFTIVSADLILVLTLCFYGLDPTNQWQYEYVAYRVGFIAAAQIPLVVLLAGKNNIIGFLVGSSYERLNWLHRWVARILFMTVTIHMGFWFTDWARYDYIMVKLKTDVITQRGFVAWCILLWIVLSSFAPLRQWNYELFIIQHIITFVGFLAAVYLHLPAEVKAYIWIPIGLYVFDRTVRTLWVIWTNLSIFYKSKSGNAFLHCHATLEPLGSDMTRIVVQKPPLRWNPGQHVFLNCPFISPLQSHPFTIASIPQDGRMEFLVKAKSGCTKTFLDHAEKHQNLPISTTDLQSQPHTSVIIDGPYGRMRPLRQFDSVFLIAGSSGGSFTVPLLRDIVRSWKQSRSGQRPKSWLHAPVGAMTRYIRFVWVVKSREQYSWFASQLEQVAKDVEERRGDGLDLEVQTSVYVTCDTALEAGGWQQKLSPRAKEAMTGHSKPEEVTNQPDALPAEGEKTKEETVSIRSTTSKSTGEKQPNPCGPNSTCCCTTAIEDEDTITPEKACTCNSQPSNPLDPTDHQTPSPTSLSPSPTKPRLPSPTPTPTSPPHPPPTQQQHTPAFLTGRPHPPSLLRKTLEQARGETAVVCCGPKGLERDVRRSVVGLCDERAVCKGSGALGVWFWGEGFAY